MTDYRSAYGQPLRESVTDPFHDRPRRGRFTITVEGWLVIAIFGLVVWGFGPVLIRGWLA